MDERCPDCGGATDEPRELSFGVEPDDAEHPDSVVDDEVGTVTPAEGAERVSIVKVCSHPFHGESS